MTTASITKTASHIKALGTAARSAISAAKAAEKIATGEDRAAIMGARFELERIQRGGEGNYRAAIRQVLVIVAASI